MLDYPYVLLQSPPIGPIALEALVEAKYPPVGIIDDPNLSTEELITQIESFKPTFVLVVGFGKILKRDVLDIVAGQVINIHPSLLPLYRGPAPVVQTILDGVTETGVTVIEIDTKMDHGPILAQEKMPLHGNETPEELYRVLTIKGVQLFLDVIENYLNERLELLPQNDLDATVTTFIKKEDGELDFRKEPQQLEREIRAFHGWPRSWVMYKDKRLIVEKAHLEDGKLVFDLVQPENSKIMAFKAFCAGQRLNPEKLSAQITRHKK